jgi:hypothetical protein
LRAIEGDGVDVFIIFKEKYFSKKGATKSEKKEKGKTIFINKIISKQQQNNIN